MVLEGKCHYVVFRHIADSYQGNDIGGGCTTQQWTQCATIKYNFIKIHRTNCLSLFPVLIRFGGYMEDDYNSVLLLHTADLVECLKILCGTAISYMPKVKRRG